MRDGDYLDLPYTAGSFYKYREIGDPGSTQRDRLRRILVDGEIYLSRPSQLNDPFDCHPSIVLPDSRTTRRFIESDRSTRLRKHGIWGARDRQRSKITESMVKLADPKFRNRIFYETFDKYVALFCTSATATSAQQWAYYAASHTGICLRFDFDFGMNVTPVTYSHDRVSIQFVRFMTDGAYEHDSFRDVLTRKSMEWSHEQEYRAIHDTAGVFKFDRASLVEVIFGVATPSEYRQFVAGEILRSGVPTAIAECRLNPHTYSIETGRATESTIARPRKRPRTTRP